MSPRTGVQEQCVLTLPWGRGEAVPQHQRQTKPSRQQYPLLPDQGQGSGEGVVAQATRICGERPSI